jgi:hypothetical protein
MLHFISVNHGKSIAVNYASGDITLFGSLRMSYSTGRSANLCESSHFAHKLIGLRKIGVFCFRSIQLKEDRLRQSQHGP